MNDIRQRVEPQTATLRDDGTYPNSDLPLVIYTAALEPDTVDAPAFERCFYAHDWRGSWRDGIYSMHHYHSTSHEVLGVYRGWADVQLGGPDGTTRRVNPGDVVIIPAGVAHKLIDSSADFRVVGAYPRGRKPDLLYGNEGERPEADHNIARLPIPDFDPVYGPDGPLRSLWENA